MSDNSEKYDKCFIVQSSNTYSLELMLGHKSNTCHTEDRRKHETI